VEVVVVNEEDVEAIIVISEKVVESVLVNDKDVKPANVNDEVIEAAIVNDKDVKVVDVNDEVMKVVVLNYKDVEVEATDAKNEVASIVDGDVNGGDDIGDKRGVEFRKEGLDESEEKLHRDDDDDGFRKDDTSCVDKRDLLERWKNIRKAKRKNEVFG